MTQSTAAPVDNLVRAMFGADAAELRAQTDDGADGGTLFGHFAVFNRWTEIHSMWEGDFLERIAPGALTDTLANPARDVKVLYDHGQDPQLGNKPLGAVRSLKEDKVGAYYEVDLLRGADGSLVPYNRDFIMPAAKAGLLGASFRFQVAGDTWDESGDVKDYNPKGLPERTITRIHPLYEFGPVTFPAYDAATASVRCGTDRWIDSLLNDPRFVARFTERLGAGAVDRIIDGLPPKPTFAEQIRSRIDITTASDRSRIDITTAPDGSVDTQTESSEEAADGQSAEDTHQRRLAYFERITAGYARSLSRRL